MTQEGFPKNIEDSSREDPEVHQPETINGGPEVTQVQEDVTTQEILEEVQNETGHSLLEQDEGKPAARDEEAPTRHDRGREVAENRRKKFGEFLRKGVKLGSEFFREVNKSVPLLAPEVMAVNGAEYARDFAGKTAKSLAILGLIPAAAAFKGAESAKNFAGKTAESLVIEGLTSAAKIQERIRDIYTQQDFQKAVDEHLRSEAGLQTMKELFEKPGITHEQSEKLLRMRATCLELEDRKIRCARRVMEKGSLSKLLARIKGENKKK